MELLIAVTLLSLVSVGMMFALRIGLNTYGKAQSHLMDNRRVAGAQRILTDELAGMVPVEAPCGGNKDGPKTPFFQGDPQVIRLVSTYSLQEGWRGHPQILEIFVMPGDGGVRLVVNEIPYYHPTQAGRLCTGPGRYVGVSPSEKSFVLADKLAICTFSYLQQPENLMEYPTWVQVFTEKRSWPKAVRIQMRALQADLSRLQPISVVMPLRIHRTPEMPYVDE
jgi:general secretion pathway protein J